MSSKESTGIGGVELLLDRPVAEDRDPTPKIWRRQGAYRHPYSNPVSYRVSIFTGGVTDWMLWQGARI